MNKIDFLNKVVFDYIKKDLETIKTNIPKKSGEVGNANFPIASCVLSYMEYLGGFLTGLDRGIVQNVTAYLDKCFKNSNKYHAGILTEIFRNGLAHDYFARGGVSRDGMIIGLYRGIDNKVTLDADTLLDDFLNSLDTFRDKLQDDSFEQRIKLAEKSIQNLEKKYKTEIEKLPYIGNVPNARTSGATTYPAPINITRPYDPNEK